MATQPVSLKEKWYDAGVSILSEPDFYSLKLDHLCTRIGLTKGSFYHHFGNMDEYETGLLKRIKKKYTLDIIHSIPRELTPQEKFNQLSDKVRMTPVYLGVNIRKWATYNPKPLAYQREVDMIRLRFLKKILMEDGLDEQTAIVMAKTRYIFFIGIENFALTYSIEMKEAVEIEALFTRMFTGVLEK